ncbi:hypothetical protein JCGZ_02550 [Jatropha curcas]|uniref:Uncharacterized protein n=1 Tax=Jatropha curcas TaxID=180498 RepID=A0A067L4U6_JATCU|nr:hypothetical protein JCGZ_02550 [Jatropha curcas]
MEVYQKLPISLRNEVERILLRRVLEEKDAVVQELSSWVDLYEHSFRQYDEPVPLGDVENIISRVVKLVTGQGISWRISINPRNRDYFIWARHLGFYWCNHISRRRLLVSASGLIEGDDRWNADTELSVVRRGCHVSEGFLQKVEREKTDDAVHKIICLRRIK